MSGLSFNSSTGVVIQDTATIRANLVTKVQQAFQRSPNEPLLNLDPSSPMGQVLDLLVAEIEAKNAEIAFLANMANPATARGVWLDALASLYFVERKTSEPTVVTCQVTGLAGTVIPYGSMVEDGNGNKLRLLETAGISIGSNGQGEGQFTTIEHGAIQINANSVTKIVTVIAGWDTVNNSASGAIGRDEETDAELYARMKASVAINGQGTVEALSASVANIDGVIASTILENDTNQTVTKYGVSMTSHSVAVSVYGGADADVAKAIYTKKSEGCGTNGSTTVTYTDPDYPTVTYSYHIVRPTAQAVKIKVSSYEAITAEEQALIKTALIADFNGESKNPRCTMASVIYASRFFYVVASNTDSPLFAVELSTDGTTYEDSLTMNATQMPTLGASDITFAVVTS